MTVAAQNSFNVINGDGVTTVFSWTFALPAGSTGTEITIYVIDNLGNVTNITGLGNYTLNVSGSNLTYPVTPGVAPLPNGATALPAGWSIGIYRLENITQALNLVTQSAFPSAGMMAAIDLLTMICQQLQEQLNRCVKYPVGQLPTSNLASAFVAAVSQGLLATPATGTYAYLKGIAANNPTTWMFGICTDQGALGEYTLMFYSGNTAVGDSGWFHAGG